MAATTDLDLLPDGVLVAGRDGRVEVVNATAAAMLGVSAHEAIGQPLPEVLRLTDRRGTTWTDDNRPYGGLSVRTGIPEQSWILPDGQETLVVARLLRDRPRGPVTGVAVTLRSGRGRARLDRDRSDLVAAVAHELRSPLTGVKGFVRALLARWDLLSDEQKRLMLTTVSADADRLSRLITELLDIARIDTGRLRVVPRPSSVRTLTDRVVASVTEGTGRPVETDYVDDLPDVDVDPDRFTQVVTNLVENAVRHGEGVVRITARAEASGGVRMHVDDEGEGIPEELRGRVFTKFWTHGHSAGTGLGMYLVGGLVKAHGGHVEIDSAPGGGARISVRWPGVPGEEQSVD